MTTPRANKTLFHAPSREVRPIGGLDRRTCRQVTEWKRASWILLIGWWFVPTVLATWAIYVTIKYTVIAIAIICKYIKEVRSGVRRP